MFHALVNYVYFLRYTEVHPKKLRKNGLLTDRRHRKIAMLISARLIGEIIIIGVGFEHFANNFRIRYWLARHGNSSRYF